MPPRIESIRLRGVRQNNLKGFDVDIPLGKYIVVTGLSGSGKSSLVFDTLHAEGQRRYVETFSPYTRQFLELLPKPALDSAENIRPSIAIEQTNTVKTSRSTVGTMTELCDYFKAWFPHVASCYDPTTGERIEDDSPNSIWEKILAAHSNASLLIAFRIERLGKLSWSEILQSLRSQSYARVLIPEKNAAHSQLQRVNDLIEKNGAPLADATEIFVVQDRIAISAENRTRFTEAVETALHFGQGEIRVFSPTQNADDVFAEVGHFSRGLHSPKTGRRFKPATPALFSFNSPLGACPRCRGFGRIIEIDYRLAIPDRSLSIDDGAIRCWEGDVYSECKRDLLRFAKKQRIDTSIPFNALTAAQQSFIIDGEPGYGTEGREWPAAWYGIRGFFQWLESKTYKMHVRVFLSRYRAYNTCPDCHGARLQPEALCWRWENKTLPDLYKTPVSDLLEKLPALGARTRQTPVEKQRDYALAAIRSRLSYLAESGLGYLTLDRASRTLSGGEVERINLTSCLGSALVDTLFVLDEPSVGLHARDIDRIIKIIRTLTDSGNTVVVVEHDEAMIRAADHIIEIGPEPGVRGGHIVFQGNLSELLRSHAAITGAYLSGKKQISLPAARRITNSSTPRLQFRDCSKHNISNLSFDLPLQRLVCLSGVSGSGKSTLLNNIIHQGLLVQRNQLAEDPATIVAIEGTERVGEIVLVDQSPLSRTPRSNPALYSEAWEHIRELFAKTDAAQAAGFTASTFSFNAGDGRCENCQGLGYETVEMQFLSDVFVPCPICETQRFKPAVLACTWNGKSISETLALTIADAVTFFSSEPKILRQLSPLIEAGLSYLTLGQPLTTLSGGEAQRLKLVRYLGEFSAATRATSNNALLLLDEPTTGLHRHDVARLLSVLQKLVDGGFSLVVIEHNIDVLKSADWLLEIGPDAGVRGGKIVCEGTPETVAKSDTATAAYLREAIAGIRPSTKTSAKKTPSRVAEKKSLRITGARENNLRNIDVEIPQGEMTVVTGVSGSGKSTLAFDIVFAEGQRRFMEAMSPYARQFVEQLARPEVDHITGIPPTVAIEQRTSRGSRKSTVASITEVAHFLRLLYARIGIQHHPETGRPIAALPREKLSALFRKTLASPVAQKARALYLCAPIVRARKGHHQTVADWMRRQNLSHMRADGRVIRVEDFKKLDRYSEHDIEAIVANFNDKSSKLTDAKIQAAALDRALSLGNGSCFLLDHAGKTLAWFSTTRTDSSTGESFPELDPKHFSFNSAKGWCPTCRGHGAIFEWMLAPKDDEAELSPQVADLQQILRSNLGDETASACPDCKGARLNRISRAVRLPLKSGKTLSLPELLAATPELLLKQLGALKLDARSARIASDILPEITERMKFMRSVGLGYLSLDRAADTLSGGEAQRIRLAAQLGSNLSGVLYVLDEPSIGLHPVDNDHLIAAMKTLRAKGNTLLIVEHDDAVMAHADRIIDLGPGAGKNGGQIIANTTPRDLKKQSRKSLTGRILAEGIAHPLLGKRRPLPLTTEKNQWIRLTNARLRNLRAVDLDLPLARLIVVAGPSGAGKSTLFRDVLRPAIACAVQRAESRLSGKNFLRFAKTATKDVATSAAALCETAPFDLLSGVPAFRSVIEVDQSPIGITPRSTPATYLGIFDLVREFFASLPEAKVRGHTAGRFSFNTAGGRCETCSGAGRVKLEMSFMPDTYVPCDDCGGMRYGPELREICWKGKNIAQVLALTFEEAVVFFDFHETLRAVCQLMCDTGLGYLSLGQSSPTLSGGEAQRLKLVTELARGFQNTRERSRAPAARNLYLLEEPTIGLHLSDCERLIRLLHRLVDEGHTVIVIEHHLDIIAEADYVVEVGPGSGPNGGAIIYQGAIDGLKKLKASPTAPYLRADTR